MHDLDYLAVDASRNDPILAPQGLATVGSAPDELGLSFLPAEHGQASFAQFTGDPLIGMAIGGDAEFRCDSAQLHGVLYFVTAFSFSGQDHGVGHVSAMIGVGGRAGGDHSDQVPGDNSVRVGAARASFRFLSERIDPARPHIADTAADAQLPEAALGLLRLPPVPSRLKPRILGVLQHLLGSSVHTLLVHLVVPP
jgi:hypothetical protein